MVNESIPDLTMKTFLPMNEKDFKIQNGMQL